MNVVNNEYFDLQEKEEACLEITVTEEENWLLAHRGRRGDEESWSNYSLSIAEAPPSPPPSAQIRKLGDQVDDSAAAARSDDSNGATQAVVDKVMHGWMTHEEELRLVREEIVQRRRDLGQNEHVWCAADPERARTELEEWKAKQHARTEEDLDD